jgi:hypothetical protein
VYGDQRKWTTFVISASAVTGSMHNVKAAGAS